MIGLNIGIRNMSAVLLSKTFDSKYKISNANTIELREGVLIPSSNEPNIKENDELRNSLQQLLKPFKLNSKNLYLSIPDQSVKVSILKFDNLPSHPDEMVKLIKWKLEKIFFQPFDDSKITYQEINKNILLVSTIKKSILSEYEQLIKSAGLNPIIIDISSFHVFNLFHDIILSTVDEKKDYVFLNLLDSTFSLIYFKNGIMDFIRIKGFRSGEMMADRLSEEMRNSLVFYGKGGETSYVFLNDDNLSEEDYNKIEIELSLKIIPLKTKNINFIKEINNIIIGDKSPLVSALGAAMGR